ncbi:ornithine decarboxylase-like [Diretmus argenteus]
MTASSPEQYDMDVLDKGRTVHDFINNKIKELADCNKPFHVANLDIVWKKHLCWVNNLPRVKPFYSVKCNNTPAVLRMLSALGTGFDCASQAEIQLALSLGVAPDRVIYAHTYKPESHIKYACARGVQLMTFDSQEELSKIARFHVSAKLVLRIAVDDSKALLRLSSKFGAKLARVGQLLQRAGDLGLEVVGVSFHVGSNCTDALAFRTAIADARRVFDIAASAIINLALDEFFPLDCGVQVIAEPGRYYVESAFTLAVEVIAKRVVMEEAAEHNSNKLQSNLESMLSLLSLRSKNSHCLVVLVMMSVWRVQAVSSSPVIRLRTVMSLANLMMVLQLWVAMQQGVQEGAEHAALRDTDVENNEADNNDRVMMYYINDGVYGSMSFLISEPGQHEVSPYRHRKVESSLQRIQSVIWGPTCCSLDKVTDNCYLPELQVGDWLLIDHVGAYSVSLSTNFNGFEKAHIYSVLTPEAWRVLSASHTGHHSYD